MGTFLIAIYSARILIKQGIIWIIKADQNRQTWNQRTMSVHRLIVIVARYNVIRWPRSM